MKIDQKIVSERNQVIQMGYKTCHALNSSLDATVCAKDCDRLKKEDFATNCGDEGGLYKCCIRRDKAFCHECRYLVWIKWQNVKASLAKVLLYVIPLHLFFLILLTTKKCF